MARYQFSEALASNMFQIVAPTVFTIYVVHKLEIAFVKVEGWVEKQ
jgi:hypothetical protein